MSTKINFIKYKHHGKDVFVREDLKGKHRDHCLCWRCEKFEPENREVSCIIANELFALCLKYGLTTPVYECPFLKQ